MTTFKSSTKHSCCFEFLAIFLAVFICVFWSVNLRAQPEKLDRIVATVDSYSVTESAVQRRIKFMRLEANQTVNAPVDDVLRQRAIEEEISYELQLRQLARFGGRITSDDVAERLAALSEQNGLTVEEFVDQFKAFNMVQDDVEKLALQTLAEEQLTQRVLIPNVEIRETEIDRYLRLNAASFDQGISEYNLDVIVVRAGEVASSEHRQQLLQVAAEVESELNRGAKFEDIAVAVQRIGGIDVGQLGWRRADDITPELYAVISRRGNKRTVGPAEIDGNLIFARVRDVRSSSGVNLPEVRQFHYAIIILQASNESGLELIQEQLEHIRKNVQDGADFAALAKLHSHDNRTRKKGGDLGWRSEDNLQFDHLEILSNLQVGDVSEVQVQQNTVYLLQLVGIRDANVEERKRSYVRSILRTHKLNNVRLKNLDQLRARAEIEYRTQF